MLKELKPISLTPETAIFAFRSMKLFFTITSEERLLTVVFDSNQNRFHTEADILHKKELDDLLVYFGFHGSSRIRVEKKPGQLTFHQEKLVITQ